MAAMIPAFLILTLSRSAFVILPNIHIGLEKAVPLEEFGENLLRIVAFILSQGVKKEALILVRNQPEQFLESNLCFLAGFPSSCLA